ncbi:MAG: polyribonucleotide nucleotidyltransferase [Defluviitaleaceae bacterium]|nr:polyribonucleotide nucleotidyltransferase [Defluviitaleaceae bacterium]
MQIKQNKYTMNLAGKDFSVETGKFAEFANASVIVSYGGTTVFVVATASEKPREGIDFFPLSVDYEERFYAIGKIPGGFVKREGRPTEKAILASRLIDRPIRPLFPEDYRNDVSIVATVMSADQDSSPEIAAMIGSSIALAISDIPFKEPTGSTNIGLVDGKFIINPDSKQREESSLHLTVASTKNKVMMIEAGANQVSEEYMYEAILVAHEQNKKIVNFVEKIVKEIGKEKHSYESTSIPLDFYTKLKDIVGISNMQNAVFTDDKQQRNLSISNIKEKSKEEFLKLIENNEMNLTTEEFLSLFEKSIYKLEKEVVRNMILKDNKRPDGRALNEMRKLTAEVDTIPRVHGAALFNRGQTQVLTITTLASMGEVQVLDGLDLSEESKRYMHHYNFPSYSVGETKPTRAPGRREIGHGALAEKALIPVLPKEDDFPYAIRTVSEVLASNGSTSQASVCASTLSLMAAGVPITEPVAGISVGLITDEVGDNFVLLTDIQGIEDFFGDMDFKVAGTKKGITAIQLDMKIEGISEEIIKNSLEETKISRYHILDEIMLKTIDKPRDKISDFAPKIAKITIDIEKIADVIGPRGKVIKRIIEESGVDKIDTEDDGRIFISSNDMDKVKIALEIIKAIVTVPNIGDIFRGKVTRVVNFGAFVEIAPEKEGLVHVSQLDKKRVEKVEDIVKVGDIIEVKVTEIDEQGRLNLSRKALL